MNYFTKVMKTQLKYDYPLEENRYSNCITDAKEAHWIVYALEEDVQAYKDHYGQYPVVKLPFLTACYAIDEKNDFLELVRYNQELLPPKKGMFAGLSSDNKRYRFKDAAQVEYVGWVPRTKLLLQNSAWNSDINLKPLRYWTGISNPDLLLERDNYFKDDTLRLFKDSNLSQELEEGVKIVIGDIVYVYRQEEEKGVMLIGKNATFSPDTSMQLLGWVDQKSIKNIGQQKVLLFPKVEQNDVHVVKQLQKKQFNLREGTLATSNSDISFFFNSQLHLSPLDDYPESTPIMLPLKVWDHTPNKVLNIDGEFIDQADFDLFKSKSKKLNVFFVFEKDQALIRNLLDLTNNIQKIWETLQKEQFLDYEVSFNAMSYTQKGVSRKATEYTNFVKWVDFIHDEIVSKDSLTPSAAGMQGALAVCDTFFSNRKQESNLLIVVGSDVQAVDTTELQQLSDNFASSTTRVLFWKIKNDISEESSNFILYAKAMLYRIANTFSKLKRHYIADFNLYHPSNRLALVNDVNNVYLFDSPNNSMYQGGVAFPKLKEKFHPILFEQILDSLLLQIAADNNTIITSLNSYFTGVGLARSVLDTEFRATLLARAEWKDAYRYLPSVTYQDKYWANYFGNTDSLSRGFQNYYLIADEELKSIINNIKALAPKLPVDFNWFLRRRLYRIHKRFGKRLDDIFCYDSKVGRISLQELLFMSNGIRTADEVTYDIQISDIKSNQKLSDDELERIMFLLREKAIGLEKYIIDHPEMSVQYQDQNYFLIPELLLP